MMFRRPACRSIYLAALALALIAIAPRSGRSQSASDLPTWKLAATIAAPEAVQAAAADQRFVYAIANRQVAKYDRKSGERVATSTGDAQHLNSGFFWDGKLYCAHSNYPRTPEKSELMVLDPATMQLTVSKDFGNFGGSLTWAVRHDDCWWCNFARYGEKNHETFLVKFDNDWRELARWTYPETVTRELKSYSLSGGLFRDGDLLVTGHDDPIVFHLRVPAEGTELVLVGRAKVPFTGQGIAADPLTGGLVGIHRSKQQILLAAPSVETTALRLRVLSYNIHHAEGTDRKLDVERIAKIIVDAKPDVVALQEVDQKVARTRSVDQPAQLARLTGMHVAFGGNIRLQGGDYGNAILSRWPIKAQKNRALPNVDRGEQRGVLDVSIELPDARPTLRFLATHFDHRNAEEERIASAKAIAELVGDDASPAILAGDLNDVMTSATLKLLQEKWQLANQDELPTIPVEKPTQQIDFVLVRPAARWRVINVEVLSEAVASDHRAILAELELLPAETTAPRSP